MQSNDSEILKENTVPEGEGTAEREYDSKQPGSKQPGNEQPGNEQPEEKSEDTLKKELEEISSRLAQAEDKYLRLMAEYDNFRKRSQKEKADIYPEAIARAVEAFLPVIDNFERALGAGTSDEKYKSGVDMIYHQLLDALTKLEVKAIDRVGEVFDPNLENAVSRIQDDSLGENVVAEVYQKGYIRGDRVIRHAMVVVANCN